MAAPTLNRAHQKDIRDKIKTSQLINRLQDFVLGGKDPKTGALIEIDAGRLKAIEVLLRKTLPDLSTVAVEGEITTNVISHKPLSPEEWAAQHGGES